MTESPFEKVTAFVTRNDPIPKILTFVHPLAGRQLPSGSVETGEQPRHAARREVAEETGCLPSSPADLLDVETSDLGEAGYMRDTRAVRSGPGPDYPSVGHISRGYKVLVSGQSGDWLEVAHRTYDLNVQPAVIVGEVRGWVHWSEVARSLRRSFFHFSVEDVRPRFWRHYADQHWLLVKWEPMVPTLSFVEGQQSWFDSHFLRLRHYLRRANVRS